MTGIGTLFALFFWLSGAMAPSPPPPRDLGTFRCTFYWVADESRHPGPPTVALLDPSGQSLATVSAAFARSLRMEGTGRLRDGRVINWAGNGRYVRSSAPWGFGIREEWPLVPFHTVAVDPAVIPYGTLLSIDAACGLPLPDGSLHDGLFVARDTGSAIKGNHIDVFVGEARWRSFLEPAFSAPVVVRRLD